QSPSPRGGTDDVRYRSGQLREVGHSPRVFAPRSRNQVDYEGFHRMGSPISIPVNDSVARISLSFHLANQVAAIVEQGAFDVLHFHEPLMPAPPITMLRMSRTADVGTFHAFANSTVGCFSG